MSDHEQQPAPRCGKVLEALARAQRKLFTRPAPKSAKARMKFLRTREACSVVEEGTAVLVVDQQ
ncbi:hypothetical protein [Streptomyces sp. enrichment culture]|uniref:hypothetical protein n=1 Tax=Streptomyces sp. enrichment culture TaxID=1795815 RepID=UPI003F5635CE